MTAPAPIVIDQYAALSHKEIIGQPTNTRTSRYTPSWVPPDDRRRLAAYLVRDGYRRNVARLLRRSHNGSNDDDFREYGDPGLLTDRVVSALLGDDWSIVVDGADGDLLTGPTLPERPADPAVDAHPIEQRIHQLRVQGWERDAAAAVDAWATALEAQPTARLRQTQLRAWADRVLLGGALTEAFDDMVALGDTLLVAWPNGDNWPTLTVYEPDAYLPVLPDNARGEFPDTIHAAWAFNAVDADGTRTEFVRRMTWRMIDVASTHVVTGPDGQPAWDGVDRPLLADNETIVDGHVVRHQPWHTNGEPGDTRTCWFTEAVWRTSDLLRRNETNSDTDPFDTAPAWWVNPGVDLRTDTIPAVHIPRTPSSKAHFGTSLYDGIAQALDDIGTTDSDVMSAASYCGDPTGALSGATAPKDMVLAPGQLYGVGENGKISMLDMSAGLEKLMAHSDRLIDRALRNAGLVPEAVGMASGDAAKSGFDRLLKLAPWAQTIGLMRLSVEPKLRILLRIVVKMAMIAGAVEPGPVGDPRVQLGSFMPTDRQSLVEDVTAALTAGAISTQTAVTMLVAGGFPVADAQAEVARIRAEDAETAERIFKATGSDQLAADWLGVELPEAGPGQPPVIELPEA